MNTEELQKIESDVDEIFTSTINETKSEYRPEAYQRIPVVTRRPYEYFTTDYQNTEFLANNNSITYEEAFPVQAEPMSTCLVSVRNRDLRTKKLLHFANFDLGNFRFCHRKFDSREGRAPIWTKNEFINAIIQVSVR